MSAGGSASMDEVNIAQAGLLRRETNIKKSKKKEKG